MAIKKFLSEFRLYLCNEWIACLPSHRIRNWYYSKIMRFDLDAKSSIFMHCYFDCAEGLTIGRFSVINARCRLDMRGGIKIGSNVSISSDVIILTADHEEDPSGGYDRMREVIIEDRVFIGTRAMILPGVVIGEGAQIAAGAVVTKSIPPYTVYGGVPAKFIKVREQKAVGCGDNLLYRRLFQ